MREAKLVPIKRFLMKEDRIKQKIPKEESNPNKEENHGIEVGGSD